MCDGIYSGYMMGEERHGAGTLINKNLCWRMEGIWCKNFGFIGTGVKEFNDGEVLTGKFVKSRFQEVRNNLLIFLGVVLKSEHVHNKYQLETG